MEITRYKVWDCGGYFSYIGVAFLPDGTHDAKILLLHNSVDHLLKNDDSLHFQSAMDTSIALVLVTRAGIK